MRSAAPRSLSEENMGRDRIEQGREEGQSQQRRAAAAVPASPASQPASPGQERK